MRVLLFRQLKSDDVQLPVTQLLRVGSPRLDSKGTCMCTYLCTDTDTDTHT